MRPRTAETSYTPNPLICPRQFLSLLLLTFVSYAHRERGNAKRENSRSPIELQRHSPDRSTPPPPSPFRPSPSAKSLWTIPATISPGASRSPSSSLPHPAPPHPQQPASAETGN